MTLMLPLAIGLYWINRGDTAIQHQLLDGSYKKFIEDWRADETTQAHLRELIRTKTNECLSVDEEKRSRAFRVVSAATSALTMIEGDENFDFLIHQAIKDRNEPLLQFLTRSTVLESTDVNAVIRYGIDSWNRSNSDERLAVSDWLGGFRGRYPNQEIYEEWLKFSRDSFSLEQLEEKSLIDPALLANFSNGENIIFVLEGMKSDDPLRRAHAARFLIGMSKIRPWDGDLKELAQMTLESEDQEVVRMASEALQYLN